CMRFTRRSEVSFDTLTFVRVLSTSSSIAFDHSGWYNLDSANQRSVVVSLIGISTQASSTTTRLPFTVYEQPHQEAFRHQSPERTPVLLISCDRNSPIGN